MFIDLRANRELGHLEGGVNDVLNVLDGDLSGNVESSASSPFDDISCSVSFLRVDGHQFIWLGAHDGLQELEQEMPAGDESWGVDTGKEPSQILVEEQGCGL